jgi:hypothetical protein
MALKAKITKEQFAKLPADIQAEYVEDGDSYKLDVEGLEDTGALRRAKDRESQGRKDAEAALREAQEELERINGDDARKKGDIATLEKSWQKKLDDQKADYEGKVAKLTSHTTKSLVDNVALSVATKISNSPQLLIPHIRARLQANFDGDEPVTVVLGKDGKPSTMTVDELSAEFVANKDFSAIIVGSKASGGASKPSTSGGGAPNNGNNDKPADLSKMNPTELAVHLKEVKANANTDQ